MSVKIKQTFERHDTAVTLMDDWRLMGVILLMILIEHNLILKKYMANLCQRVSITLGQRSSNGQNYAIVCPT